MLLSSLIVSTVHSTFLVAIHSIPMVLVILEVAGVLDVFGDQLPVPFSLVKHPLSIIDIVRRWVLLLIACVSASSVSHVVKIVSNVSHVSHCIVVVPSPVEESIDQWAFVIWAIFIVKNDFFNLGRILCSITDFRLMFYLPDVKGDCFRPSGEEFKVVLLDAIFQQLCKKLRSLLLAHLWLLPRFVCWAELDWNWDLGLPTWRINHSWILILFLLFLRSKDPTRMRGPDWILQVAWYYLSRRHYIPVLVLILLTFLIFFLIIHSIWLNLY